MARKPSVTELAALRAQLRGSAKEYRPYSVRIHKALLVEITTRGESLDMKMLEVFEEALLDWLGKTEGRKSNPP